jgi:hypothetical protein
MLEAHGVVAVLEDDVTTGEYMVQTGTAWYKLVQRTWYKLVQLKWGVRAERGCSACRAWVQCV